MVIGEYYLISSKKLSGFADETVLRLDKIENVAGHTVYHFQNEYSLKPVTMTEKLFNKSVLCMLPSEHRNKVGKWLGYRKAAKQWLSDQQKKNPGVEVTVWDALIAVNAVIKLSDVVLDSDKPNTKEKIMINSQVTSANIEVQERPVLNPPPVRPQATIKPIKRTYQVVVESESRDYDMYRNHHAPKPFNAIKFGKENIPGFNPEIQWHKKLAIVLNHNQHIKLEKNWFIRKGLESESDGYGKRFTVYVRDVSGKIQRIQPYVSTDVEFVPT